jgi:hypothetical protein
MTKINWAEYFDILCKMLDEIDYWHKNNYIPIEIKCGESEFVSAFRRVFYPKNKYLQLAEML